MKQIYKTTIATVFCLCTLETHSFGLRRFYPNYKEVLKLSLLFYEAQRSGYLPNTNRVKWRGDSALNDHGIRGEDLTGGYYDATDYVKFSFTMAFTTTILSWGVLSYNDSYKQAGQFDEARRAIKWATDYFIKCHVSANEFYGQVGDFQIDHTYWGRPEEMNMSRPAYKIDKDHPGSDLAAEASAALSSASLIFKDEDMSYSEELLRHSKELYDFAKSYKGLFQEIIPGAKEYYESTSYGDELTWAAIWLYKATNEKQYLEEAETFYIEYNITARPNDFFYNNKGAGIQVLMAEQTNNIDYVDAVRSFCDYAIEKQTKTPDGLIFLYKQGTLGHAANIAFICLKAADLGIKHQRYIEFAKQQIDYILGSKGRSFVVGYGLNYPKNPHHSASSCPDLPAPCGWETLNSTSPNPQILYGAIVSGPDQNDFFEDNRQEYLYTEVTLDFNAGFQSALAGLIHYSKSNEGYFI